MSLLSHQPGWIGGKLWFVVKSAAKIGCFESFDQVYSAHRVVVVVKFLELMKNKRVVCYSKDVFSLGHSSTLLQFLDKWIWYSKMLSKRQIETQVLLQVERNKTCSFIKIPKFSGRFY